MASRYLGHLERFVVWLLGLAAIGLAVALATGWRP
jgi:hypothetical protein